MPMMPKFNATRHMRARDEMAHDDGQERAIRGHDSMSYYHETYQRKSIYFNAEDIRRFIS